MKIARLLATSVFLIIIVKSICFSQAFVRPVAALRDGHSGDWFGGVIAMSSDGKTIVIGAPAFGSEHGAVYIFVEPEGGWTANPPYTAVLSSENTHNDALFGSSVAVDETGSTIVVAREYGPCSDAVGFVFNKPAVGWKTTSRYSAKLVSTQAVCAGFMAIKGNTIVQSAMNPYDGTGVGLVFLEPAKGWHNIISEAANLTPSDQTSGDDFGPIAISGDTVAIGATQFDTQAHGPGAVYVYEKPTSGWHDITETAKLTASDGKDWDSLGGAIAMEGSTIVAGAYQNNVGNGKAYVFVKPETGWISSTETAELTAKEATDNAWFGSAVAISGNRIIVGAPQQEGIHGAAYIYAEPPSGWQSTDRARFELKPPSSTYQDFGAGLKAVCGTMAIAGFQINVPNVVFLYGQGCR